MLYFESEYRFGILKNGFLSGAVYANVSSYSERVKNNVISAAHNVGVSLRIKVNKHSNTNLIVSYGVGKTRKMVSSLIWEKRFKPHRQYSFFYIPI